MAAEIRVENFPLKDETESIIGIGIEIHKTLGLDFSKSFTRMLLNMNSETEIYFMKEKKSILLDIKKLFCLTNFTQTSLCQVRSFLK